MKKEKIRYLYNDTFDSGVYEDEREFLFEEYGEEQNWKTKEDVPDDWIWNGLQDIYDEDWQILKSAVGKLLETKYLIAVGFADLWHGKVSGGKFIKDMKDFENLVCGYDNLAVWDNNGHLKINMYHHDGTNQVEIKYLTRKGENFAYANDWAHDKELHEKIFKYNLFSGTPKLAKELGW